MANPDEAVTALVRFGLGPRIGDAARIRSDPRGALLAEIRQGPVRPTAADLLDGAGALAAIRARAELDRKRAQAARASGPSPPALAAAGSLATMTGSGYAVLAGAGAVASGEAQLSFRSRETVPADPGAIFLAEARARFETAASVEIGFVERLVWFWSNHFAVSALKDGNVRGLAGAYEREAIRPHVLGRFSDLLWAAETHPAMLFYLDNQASVGPGSPAGQRRGRGLNENLGREILELHTLGVGGGYDQGDVTALAKILTGWTVVGPEGRIGRPGTAAFNVNAHEPGDQTLLGKAYGDHGPDQLRDALADVARHPATAAHVAAKLARHFVADEPPPALVARLTRCFRDTDGDLAAVSTTLVQSPEAWAVERTKMRLPAEFIVATARLLGAPVTDPRPLVGGMGLLGQPLWSPQGPNGYSDRVETWASPEGMKVRLDVAARAAQRLPAASPAELLDAALGGAASAATREAVGRAESRPQAVALLLMSPEFQRR